LCRAWIKIFDVRQLFLMDFPSRDRQARLGIDYESLRTISASSMAASPASARMAPIASLRAYQIAQA
jgi:hypothetical protein